MEILPHPHFPTNFITSGVSVECSVPMEDKELEIKTAFQHRKLEIVQCSKINDSCFERMSREIVCVGKCGISTLFLLFYLFMKNNHQNGTLT